MSGQLMKYRLPLIVILGLCIGIGAGLLAAQAPLPSSARESGFRTIASLNAKQMPMGKTMALVHVALEAPEGIPGREEQETTLVGRIRMNQNIPADLNYRWELPEGVHVVTGHVEDSWSGVQQGQILETTLTVTGFSRDQMKLIVLHGFVKTQDGEFGGTSVLNSRPEESYEMLSASSTHIAAGVDREPASKTAVKPVLTGKIVR